DGSAEQNDSRGLASRGGWPSCPSNPQNSGNVCWAESIVRLALAFAEPLEFGANIANCLTSSWLVMKPPSNLAQASLADVARLTTSLLRFRRLLKNSMVGERLT